MEKQEREQVTAQNAIPKAMSPALSKVTLLAILEARLQDKSTPSRDVASLGRLLSELRGWTKQPENNAEPVSYQALLSNVAGKTRGLPSVAARRAAKGK